MSIVVKMVEDHTAEVLAEFHRKKQMALEMIGLQAEGYVQFLAPYDTGRLRNSITHRLLGDDAVAVGTNVEYAVYQEMGTSRMLAANGGIGYLRPGVQNHMDEYRSIADQAMRS